MIEELVGIMKLIVVLLVVVRFIVVKGDFAICTIDNSGWIVCPVGFQHGGGNTIPCLVCFFFSGEKYRLKQSLLSEISCRKVKGV